MAKNEEISKRASRNFYGAVTVGERGQIVIPQEARQKFDIQAGDKLLIFSGFRSESLSVMKAEKVTEYVSRAMARLSEMEEIMRGEEK